MDLHLCVSVSSSVPSSVCGCVGGCVSVPDCVSLCVCLCLCFLCARIHPAFAYCEIGKCLLSDCVALVAYMKRCASNPVHAHSDFVFGVTGLFA